MKPGDEATRSVPAVAEDPMTEIRRRFTYHPPKDNQFPRYEAIRNHALGFAEFIVANTPVSREQALALTKLEESVFFANAAIARRG